MYRSSFVSFHLKYSYRHGLFCFFEKHNEKNLQRFFWNYYSHISKDTNNKTHIERISYWLTKIKSYNSISNLDKASSDKVLLPWQITLFVFQSIQLITLLGLLRVYPLITFRLTLIIDLLNKRVILRTSHIWVIKLNWTVKTNLNINTRRQK